jgi:hypothetical protein
MIGLVNTGKEEVAVNVGVSVAVSVRIRVSVNVSTTVGDSVSVTSEVVTSVLVGVSVPVCQGNAHETMLSANANPTKKSENFLTIKASFRNQIYQLIDKKVAFFDSNELQPVKERRYSQHSITNRRESTGTHFIFNSSTK